jgi:hypothetical protein
MKPPREERPPPSWLPSWWLGAAFVALAYLALGAHAAVRAGGLLIMLYAYAEFLKARIPYGWEGREPSGYLEGTAAKVVAALFGLVGLAAAIAPDFMLVVVGWE